MGNAISLLGEFDIAMKFIGSGMGDLGPFYSNMATSAIQIDVNLSQSLSKKNMQEKEESNDEEVPDYVDKAGRRWHFLVHAKQKEDLAQFVQQNGLVPGNENGKRRKFGCSRPECHFRAVFLKANSGIYTRGEHFHEHLDGEANENNNDKTTASGDILKKGNERIVCSFSAQSKIICRGNEEIFICKNRTEFRLVHRFETDDEFEDYRRENWLMKRGKTYKDRLNLSCRRYSNRNKMATNCRVSGIYVKRNHSLYQNSEQHNHPTGKENEDYFSRFLSKYADNKKADYVGQKGQIWHFFRQIDNLDELEKCAKKQMLYVNSKMEKQIYFKCKYAHPAIIKYLPYPPPYCKKRAVFVKATSSVYIRNEHSHHPAFKLKKSSKSWSRHSKLYRGLAAFFEIKIPENNLENENAEQNVPMLKEEADEKGEEEGEEVRIVKHLQRDYKCLGRMKREGGEEQSRTDLECLTDGEEEGMDLEEGTSQATRGRRGRSTFYRYTQRELQRPMKKEEPEEADEPAETELPVPQPRVPPNITWLQQFEMARPPAKMLLRERKKRINYGK